MAFFVIFYADLIIWMFINFPETQNLWQIYVANAGISGSVVLWELLTLRNDGTEYFKDPWNYLDMTLILVNYYYFHIVTSMPIDKLVDNWKTPKFKYL